MAIRSFQPYTRRSRLPQLFVGSLLGLFIVSGGVIGTLALLGVDLNPFATKQEDPFMVRIPINAKPIPAYSRVDRSHLLNPETGGLMFQKVPPKSTIGMSIVGIDSAGSHTEGAIEDVKRVGDEVVFLVSGGHEVRQSRTIDLGGAKMNINDIIGRVVKRDKRAGLGFRDETFFPLGTPEGIAGATPPGMRTITLDATKLTGVHALNAGDHIDLMASVAEAPETSNAKAPSGDVNSLIGATQYRKGDDQATQPFLLAQDALVLKPVYVRTEAEASSSLTQGKRVQNIPKYEVAIAVKPDDVIPLQSALHKQLAITCIARSMQPGNELSQQGSVSPDMVRVPVTVRAILAYDVVSRDAFVSPATRVIRMEEVSRQEVERLGIVTSLNEALGSIVRHDIPSGSFVRQSDLLQGAVEPAMPPAQKPNREVIENTHAPRPTDGSHFVVTQEPSTAQTRTATVVGDRPSITRFIPAGRTAFAIPWNRIYGGEHLQIGDSIDLLASYSLESEDEEEETETRADGTKIVRKKNSLATRKTERTWEESFGFRGEPWFVASNATVVGPVGFPAPASALRALEDPALRGSENRNEDGIKNSGPAIIVAVDEQDVESVAAAMATKRALFTVAFHAQSDQQTPLPAGLKQIALAPEHIDAYQLFDENRWKGNRRRSVSKVVRADDPRYASAIEVTEIDRYFGRTLGVAKSRGDFYVSDDFLPAGHAKGIAAAARPGHSVFAVADREIEGLDNFSENDRVSVMIRGVVKPPAGLVAHGFNLNRPVASVIVPELRVARSSVGGQTVLEVRNEDLAILQAALASMLTKENGKELERSNLIAIAVPPNGLNAATEEVPAGLGIAGFDPLKGMQTTEMIVGSRRQTHAFLEDSHPASRRLPAVAR